MRRCGCAGSWNGWWSVCGWVEGVRQSSVSMSVSFPVFVVVRRSVVVVVVVEEASGSDCRSLPRPRGRIMAERLLMLPPAGARNRCGVDAPELFRDVGTEWSGVSARSAGVVSGETGARAGWGMTGDGWWLAGRERTLNPGFGSGAGAGGSSVRREAARWLLGRPIVGAGGRGRG